MAAFINRQNLQGIKKFAFFIVEVFSAWVAKKNLKQSIRAEDLPRQLQKDLGLGVSPEDTGSWERRWRQELIDMRRGPYSDRMDRR